MKKIELLIKIFLTMVYDLGFRKCIVDTLSAIGMSRNTIEEEINASNCIKKH